MTLGWDYPPGTNVNDPHLSGMWPCAFCERSIGDGAGACERCDGADFAADHCDNCCNKWDEE